MRTLMVLDREFPPDLRVENEIDALVNAGHEVHLACYTRKGRPDLERSGNLTVHRRPISVFTYKSSVAALTLPFYFRFWKEFLEEVMQQESFDAIHVHDLPLAGPCAGLKKKHGLKLVADLHENWPAFVKMSKHTNTPAGKLLSPVYLWRRYERKVLQHADAVVVVVDEAKERLVRESLARDRIHVVSNTLNIDRVPASAPENRHEGTLLFYAGGINHHRGLQDVVTAIYRSRNRNIRFWILGEGSYREPLERLVKRLSLQDRVLFKGFQPFGTMMEMLQEADFALIPHIRNEHTDSTIPHKLFQYMYARKPVIASDCLPIMRILAETGAGITYHSQHPDDLTHILDGIEQLDNEGMADKGRKAVLSTYNWAVDSSVLTDIYRQINPMETRTESEKKQH